MKGRFLVEEHSTRVPYGDDTISFHAVVEAISPRHAMRLAAKQHRFMFDPNELVEWVPGYAWSAADGSECFVEVRLIEMAVR